MAPPPLAPPPVEPRRAAPPLPVAPGRAAPPPAPAPRAPRPAAGTPTTGAHAVLTQFAAIDGVQWAVLVDREGFLLDASAEAAVDPETAGALSAGLVESSEGLGRELGRGVLQGMILEYEQGIIVLYNVGVAAILAIGVSEAAVLGKVRYYAKKVVPELMQAV